MRLALVYSLPFGPGKAIGASWRGLPARLVEGWLVSAYFTAASGQPFTITHANGRPVRLRNAARSGGVSSRLGDQVDPATRRVLNPYFDIAAFTPLASQYVVSPEPPYFDELRAPAAFGRNIMISKEVRIWERVRLHLRGEATNFTNTPDWGNPGTNMSNQATFGVIESAGNGRSIQMSARLTF
jgi:hypothetical protein